MRCFTCWQLRLRFSCAFVRNAQRSDITSSGMFPPQGSAASDYTLAQLENLAQPVTIYPVYTAGSTLSLKDLQTETLLPSSRVFPGRGGND